VALLQEALLGRLGSRFSLNFRPREHRVYISPMGRFYDKPLQLGLGLEVKGKEFLLPFCDRGKKTQLFSPVSQEFLLEGLRFTARDMVLGVEFVCTIHSPFYPGDKKVSGAPFYYLDLEIRSFLHGRKEFVPVSGKWVCRLAGVKGISLEHSGAKLKIQSALVKDCWYNTSECPRAAKSCFSEGVFTGEVGIFSGTEDADWQGKKEKNGTVLKKKFQLVSPRQVITERLIITGYQPGAVMKVKDRPCAFLYTRWFPDTDAVLAFARAEREKLVAKTALFTETVTRSSLDSNIQSLLACGFQNYLANSWWVCSQDGKTEGFFIWEGWCAFHSTLDVEYNNAWFPLLYWPELLEKQFDFWFQALLPEGFPSHDLGVLLEVKKQVYPHHMQVEESCNLLLLAYALWRFRDWKGWREYMPDLLRVTDYLLTVDTTGNGYPDRGVANSIDDATATVQYAGEQTYLAVKIFSALTAFSELSKDFRQFSGKTIPQEKEAAAMREKIIKTMEDQAWQGNYYMVCLPSRRENLRDVWTGKEIDHEELAGWNASSLYTANGLLFLLAAGLEPPLNYDRLRTDLVNAREAGRTLFGATHSSFDRNSVWLSQNIWSDLVACYLRLDFLGAAGCCWDFLQWENTQARGGCYVDSYGWNWLSYYPRGATAFGFLAALAGMRVNAQEKIVTLAPPRLPCRCPLLPLADWEKGEVPWIDFSFAEGKLQYCVAQKPAGEWKIKISSEKAGSCYQR